MKKRVIFIVLMLALVFSVPAFAADFDFFGNIAYHNDVLSWQVTTGAATVTVFSSSWDEGNFDPMLAVWDNAGVLQYQQDDGGNVGSTLSNGTAYTHGTWDTWYTLALGAGTYTLTMVTYNNWAVGTNLSQGFNFDNQTPIPIASWNQPANGYRGSAYAVHFVGAQSVIPNNQVPEPATLLLLGLGLVGVAGYRKIKK